jgi:hypothetical protein
VDLAHSHDHGGLSGDAGAVVTPELNGLGKVRVKLKTILDGCFVSLEEGMHEGFFGSYSFLWVRLKKTQYQVLSVSGVSQDLHLNIRQGHTHVLL